VKQGISLRNVTPLRGLYIGGCDLFATDIAPLPGLISWIFSSGNPNGEAGRAPLGAKCQ